VVKLERLHPRARDVNGRDEGYFLMVRRVRWCCVLGGVQNEVPVEAP
jgi:hypothetical protein